jgi:hypothetical protein
MVNCHSPMSLVPDVTPDAVFTLPEKIAAHLINGFHVNVL